ncbi:MAG: sialidase, partial [Clostridium celatum]|nr:sialidase [Clostridium celatum]
PISSGEFTYSGKNKIEIRFNQPVSGQYIKLVGLSAVNGQNFAACAELDILEVGAVETDESEFQIKSSDLTIADIITEDSANRQGKKVAFKFEPINKNGVNWDITMNVVMEDGDHFMRKYLEISCDDPSARIDYIDLEHLKLNESVEQEWSRPQTEGAMMLNSYQMALGQPIYIDGMFLGCEFPVTDNQILSDRTAQIKYYSGREFEDLEKTTDGKFVTWQTVVGAARSTDQSVIQTDFFEYIDEIATRTDFRKQYNSWYDHMMNITAENIEGSFYEIEKGLSQYGIEPLDSYVVDDGWNNYDADFWSFNSKFPNELYDSKEQAQNFGSNFGLWLGPRGGYNYNYKFGKQMEVAGTGGFNPSSGDICVGDHNYVENITNLFLDYMNRFDINYWKIDGNVSHPCPVKTHGHVTGGENGMYMLTETWESWIDIFAKNERV